MPLEVRQHQKYRDSLVSASFNRKYNSPQGDSLAANPEPVVTPEPTHDTAAVAERITARDKAEGATRKIKKLRQRLPNNKPNKLLPATAAIQKSWNDSTNLAKIDSVLPSI